MSARRRWYPIARRSMLGVAGAIAMAVGLAPWHGASADTVKPLYTFCLSGICTDGEGPEAALIRDTSGNLYGTTEVGGAHAGGTVFELMLDPATKKWKEKVLYSFCSTGDSNHPCTDSGYPTAGVTMDESEDLYGTTSYGGAHGAGAVFELVFDAAKKKRTEKVLYSFCAHSNSQATCTDGSGPTSGVMRDKSGNLYGTTGSGGAHAYGTVFELTFDAVTKKWTEMVLYSFCPQLGCADGSGPSGGVIMNNGNLYGVASGGGTTCNPGCGVVFELTFDATKKKWEERVLYSPDGTHGSNPVGGVIIDSGNLYGVTEYGGSHLYGTVFEVTLDPATKTWQGKAIYNFCEKSGCANGGFPQAGVIMNKGNLFGTTAEGGGAGGPGTVFELMLDPATKTWHEKVLHGFCLTNCADGWRPLAGLIIDNSGNLYGTTVEGGSLAECNGIGCGVVFELKP
jgi:uncharacterized repeat protein (TIGR03803 family)